MADERVRMEIKKLTALFLIFCVGCAHPKTPPYEGGPVTNSQFLNSNSREIEVGRQIHQAIVTSFHVYTEPRVIGYVTRMGRSVSRSAERKDLQYQFTVLYDERIYATEAPGGYVYITTGFLNFIQNEAELASVLAHEIAELQFRELRFSKSRQAMLAATTAGTVAAPLLGPFGGLAALGLVLLNSSSQSEWTPEERIKKSDEKALRYLVKAGLDPQGYLDLMIRFLNPDPRWAPYAFDYLSSRSVTLQRYQDALAQFQKLDLEGRNLSVFRGRYLEMTKGVRQIYQNP